MNIAEEIRRVNGQLADADRVERSAAELRARRDQLVRAQQLEAEAQQRAIEARDAAAKLKAAERADREAKAAPLVAALSETERALADLDRATEQVLWAFVRVARDCHQRHAELVATHAATLAALRAVDRDAAHMVLRRDPQSLRQFVTRRWERFNARGLAADGSCQWSRTLDGEVAS